MNIVPEKSTLIIAGGFNPAILKPSWILEHVLERTEDQNLPVEILSPVHGTGPVRFSFDGFSYTPTTQRLIIHLEGMTPEQCDAGAGQAAKLLNLLPHTPVTGVGFNFSFETEDPSARALGMFVTPPEILDSAGEGAEVVARSWGCSIKCADEVVGVTSLLKGRELMLDLNFHTSSDQIGSVATLLRSSGVFSGRLAKAQAFAAAFNG